jgi:hypothetical protein
MWGIFFVFDCCHCCASEYGDGGLDKCFHRTKLSQWKHLEVDVSRGPGRIQRAIESTFRQNPSSTYSVDELAAVAYPGINQVEKKHRVAVLRAAAAAAETCGWWYGQAQRPGHSMIYGYPLDLRSYAIWTMRRDFLSGSMTPEQLAKALDDPKDWRSEWKNVQPGGSWWYHVEINRADREGDEPRASQMRAELNSMAQRRFEQAVCGMKAGAR